MDQQLSLVTEWLLCASSQISAPYFQLPVAGTEDSEVRERAYCYELYHRWRSHWPDDFAFSLNGEVDKSGHSLILGNLKPDFLVHVPGQMSNNLLVMEVKPANADKSRMVDDLKKLTYFRRGLKDQYGKPANYHAAYFWLYGLPMAEWPQVRSKILTRLQNSTEFDRTAVTCVIHEAAAVRAVPVSWGDAA